MKKQLIRICGIVLVFLFYASNVFAQNERGIVIKGQGSQTRWIINGVPLEKDITLSNEITKLTLLDDHENTACVLQESNLRYYPLKVGYKVSETVIGENKTLVYEQNQDQGLLELNFVLSKATSSSNESRTYEFPEENTKTFSVNFIARKKLDQFAKTTKVNQPVNNIEAFIKSIFLLKYYTELLELDPYDPDAEIMQNRRFFFARAAANLLHVQHSKNKKGEFRTDPAIMPEGDAYTLLLESLAGNKILRNKVLETRFRVFSSLLQEIENAARDPEAKLDKTVLQTAKSISECLLSTDGIETVDPDLREFLEKKNFYIPSARNEIFEVKDKHTFNLWRSIHNIRFREGAPEGNNWNVDEELAKLFEL